MQLTKDNVKTGKQIHDYPKINKGWYKQYLDFSKFQQVVEFYEKYKDSIDLFQEEYRDIFMNQYLTWVNEEGKLDATIVVDAFKDWLFSYCFKDGLK